jgi:hypothetical protein
MIVTVQLECLSLLLHLPLLLLLLLLMCMGRLLLAKM